MSVPRAVLDADLIFSRVLHELMGRLATGARLFDLVWSDELLDEAKSSLMKRKGLSADALFGRRNSISSPKPTGKLPVFAGICVSLRAYGFKWRYPRIRFAASSVCQRQGQVTMDLLGPLRGEHWPAAGEVVAEHAGGEDRHSIPLGGD